MTRFNMFTDEELDAMEAALCNEGLRYLVEEVRKERDYRDYNRHRLYYDNATVDTRNG